MIKVWMSNKQGKVSTIISTTCFNLLMRQWKWNIHAQKQSQNKTLSRCSWTKFSGQKRSSVKVSKNNCLLWTLCFKKKHGCTCLYQHQLTTVFKTIKTLNTTRSHWFGWEICLIYHRHETNIVPVNNSTPKQPWWTKQDQGQIVIPEALMKSTLWLKGTNYS